MNRFSSEDIYRINPVCGKADVKHAGIVGYPNYQFLGDAQKLKFLNEEAGNYELFAHIQQSELTRVMPQVKKPGFVCKMLKLNSIIWFPGARYMLDI